MKEIVEAGSAPLAMPSCRPPKSGAGGPAWVRGVETLDQALARLQDTRPDGVLQKMRWPFLVFHGEQDEQVPLEVAQRLYEASGSADKTLRVSAAGEGCAQQCLSDQLTVATANFADWLGEKLA
jgi:esterase/lipase